SVDQHIFQRHIRETGLSFVGRNVAGIVAIELKQAYGLTGARQRRAWHVGGSEIASQIRAVWARTVVDNPGGCSDEWDFLEVLRMRPLKVVQSADMQQWHGCVDRRFNRWRIKRAGFGGVGIGQYPHMERPLDVRYSGLNVQQK